MSFIGIVDNIVKAYYGNNIDKSSLINNEMKSSEIQNIVNSSHFDIIYKKGYIEALLKNTGLVVADMLIENTSDEKSKEFMINYCIAMLFKHNKYEAAMMTTFKYTCNIARVYNYMQESNTNIDILKAIFTKFYDELNTIDNRKWLMNRIGMYNNIELLSHVEQYYDIDDDDIMNILWGTTDKHDYYCLNTIKYIFENYEFEYYVDFMVNFIKELYYLEHDEAIDYVMVKLVNKNGVNYIDSLLNNSNMDSYYRSDFIDYFITVFKKFLLPNALNNINEILVNINSGSNKELLDAIIKYYNQSIIS
jgi:hypothetical protein